MVGADVNGVVLAGCAGVADTDVVGFGSNVRACVNTKTDVVVAISIAPERAHSNRGIVGAKHISIKRLHAEARVSPAPYIVVKTERAIRGVEIPVVVVE